MSEPIFPPEFPDQWGRVQSRLRELETRSQLVTPSTGFVPLLHAHGTVTAGLAAGTYLLNDAGAVVTSAAVTRLPSIFLDSVEYGDSPLRLVASVLPNATAPGVIFTFSLRPISAVAGGAGSVAVTLGAGVGDVATVSAGASTPARDATLEFAFPATGHYVLAVVTDVAVAASSFALLNAQVQRKTA